MWKEAIGWMARTGVGDLLYNFKSSFQLLGEHFVDVWANMEMSSWESRCRVQVRRYRHRKCPHGYSREEQIEAKCNFKVYKKEKKASQAIF